ncbi:MAG: DUF192 domain-containing protein [bacterium]|nr:DUF192 domain-containing protein [bacterium]
MKINIDNKMVNITVCKNIFKRFKGFMFCKKIDKILCFPKCNSIHTFFMFKSIDVIMTDKNFKILYIYKNFKPWKIILPKKNAYYTFEFPTNKFKFKPNEKLKINL